MPFGPHVRAFLRRESSLAFGRSIAVLLGIFLLYRVMRRAGEGVAKADYEGAFYLGSTLIRSIALPGFYLFLLAAGVMIWANRGYGSWKALVGETRFHYVIWVVIGILAWSSALYPYNFYYGQAHLLDRLLIVGTGFLSLRYPAALPAFTFCVLSSYGQWRIPLGDPEITNRKIVLDFLLTLNAILLLRRWKWCVPSVVVIALMSVTFIHYWLPGLAKFEAGNTSLEWLLEDRPSNMMVAGHVVGWNKLWSAETMTVIYAWLAPLEIPLKGFVLVVELVLVLSFLNRRLLIALAIGRVMLHSGIWILSGDTFWNWILLQLSICVAFWRCPNLPDLFGWRPALLSAFFVVVAGHSYQASPLGWMDSRLVEHYEVYANTGSGERLQVPPGFFEPYGFIFAQAKFNFLLDEGEKTLTRTYGSIHDPRIAKRMRGAKSPDEVRALIEEEGTVEVDERKKKALRRFLQRWFANRQEKAGAISGTMDFLAPPPHAYAFAARGEAVYDGKTPVKKVEIVRRVVFFDGQNYHEWGGNPVYSVDVSK